MDSGISSNHVFLKWIKSLVVLVLAGCLPAALLRADALSEHPNAEQLRRIFAAPAPAEFAPTGVTRADYLKLIGANIDFWKKLQNAAGAIIDPFSKGERQYSTPAFAAAAGLLVKDAGRRDLLDPASRALSCALAALVENRAADKHADFYIPMLVHAYRSLKDLSPEADTWARQLQRINPEKVYRADLRKMNWNIVSSSGELLRRHDGLVAEDQRDAQMAYLEQCIGGHLVLLTPIGLFHDPGAPMVYDAFSRLWLEDALADKSYAGQHARRIEDFLAVGGLSSLLLLSPTGEWPGGGRSGLHNWGEAQLAAICEMNAARWKAAGRNDIAGAFKRGAHLAFQSVARWQRPGGDLWIIKNRAEPQARLAFEGYSNHSQYNLLPVAMLAIAYSRADETITERPTPSEVGGYVFDARQTFHKVAAAAGGYYVLIDTAADPHYNATGLQRVHRTGVPYSAVSDSAAAERAFAGDGPKAALTPGIAWKSNDNWQALADFSGKGKRLVGEVALKSDVATPAQVQFTINYALTGGEARTVAEKYEVSADGVKLSTSVEGPAGPFRIQLAVLVSDGANDTDVKINAKSVSIACDNCVTLIDASENLQLQPDRLVNHNGYVQRATAEVKGPAAVIAFRLSRGEKRGQSDRVGP